MTGPTATADESAEPVTSERPPTRSGPTAPVTRKQVDDFGRMTGRWLVRAIAAIATAVASVARVGARSAARTWRAIEAVPADVRLLSVLALSALLGVAGAIALAGTTALVCTVVVIPMCCIALGAVGHRKFGAPAGTAAPTQSTVAPDAGVAELERSVTYVDKKLTLALNSLGSERHQQAVIALFQAKTAVELALGTERDGDDHDDAPVHVDAYRLRPRIQAGPRAVSSDADSLAAS